MKVSDITALIGNLGPRNGNIRLPAASIDVNETLLIDQPCIGLQGDQHSCAMKAE